MEGTKPVGKCELDQEGNIIELVREYYNQGMVFKDWDAYQNRPNDPCYVPELSDTVYTKEDFLRLCNGQKSFADELFEGCDWEHPETLFEDWRINDEWRVCEKCGWIVDIAADGDIEKCPKCGKGYEEE